MVFLLNIVQIMSKISHNLATNDYQRKQKQQVIHKQVEIIIQKIFKTYGTICCMKGDIWWEIHVNSKYSSRYVLKTITISHNFNLLKCVKNVNEIEIQ